MAMAGTWPDTTGRSIEAPTSGRRDPIGERGIPRCGRWRRHTLLQTPSFAPRLLLTLMASLLLGPTECASSSAMAHLESNEILLLSARKTILLPPPSELVSPDSSSTPSFEVSAASVPDEGGTPPLEPPSPLHPVLVVSNAAEARRPNLTSRNEGSRRQRPGDIRCYCNVPRCVSTGYMCKSASGACFSDLADRSDVELATHGCIELLPSWRRGECRTGGKPLQPNTRPTITGNPRNSTPYPNKNSPGADATLNTPEHSALSPFIPDASTNKKDRVVVLLLCCHSDLCNHIDSPEIRLRLTNDSLFAGATSGVVPQGSSVDGGESAGNPALYFGNSQDGWFRVATIAVPICGAIILMLLIFVAFKILRPDSEDQKLHGQRSKQCHSGGTQAWDEEDLCLRHHNCQAQGHLLSPDIAYPEDVCHSGDCGKSPSAAQSLGLNSINAKAHLLPQRTQVETSSAQKKSTKLDYLFLFSRTGKSEKIEAAKLQQLPTSVGATKATEVPVAVSLQGRQDQI